MNLFQDQEDQQLDALPFDKFDGQWRRASQVMPVGVASVDAFIKLHYLCKRPAIVLLCLAMVSSGVPVGCVIFSAPSPETSIRYGGKTWELARLYLLDRVPRNAETWLIGRGIRWIKAHHPDVACLVSYADPAFGHSGVIYRASNWTPDGMTDEERTTPRSDYIDANTGKKYGRRGNMPSSAVVSKSPRISKHRFFYKLTNPKTPCNNSLS